jgi:hypothetical protein
MCNTANGKTGNETKRFTGKYFGNISEISLRNISRERYCGTLGTPLVVVRERAHSCLLVVHGVLRVINLPIVSFVSSPRRFGHLRCAKLTQFASCKVILFDWIWCASKKFTEWLWPVLYIYRLGYEVYASARNLNIYKSNPNGRVCKT